VSLPAIHHVQVAIPTGGEDAARRFYGALLGLREIPKPEHLRARGGVWFATGSLELHLGVDPSFSPSTKAHVAYQVADLAAVRARLVAAGVAVAEDEPLPGHARVYLGDPFGNRVELLQALADPGPAGA
jgi:catechol 2,3-dioxygenase-like lactoylglutathione lyase family enzyme